MYIACDDGNFPISKQAVIQTASTPQRIGLENPDGWLLLADLYEISFAPVLRGDYIDADASV